LVCPITDCTILEPVDKAAVSVLGWNARFINDGLTPQALDDAMSLAISQHPAAIFVGGFPRSEMNAQIAQAEAAGIPIIDSFVADSPGNGITAVVVGTPSTLIGGSHLADWVLSKEGKAADTLFLTSTTFPDVVVRQQGFSNTYHQLCPTCKLDVLNLPATTFGTTAPASVVAELRRNPQINYIVAGEPDTLIGLPQAMTSAGLQTPIVAGYVDPTDIAYLRDNTQLKALVEHGSALAQWESVDALLRYLSGQSVAPDEGSMPSWVITPAEAVNYHRPYIQVADYQAQFEKLWGVG
jgi:ribose transport system substrate-binding protein